MGLGNLRCQCWSQIVITGAAVCWGWGGALPTGYSRAVLLQTEEAETL